MLRHDQLHVNTLYEAAIKFMLFILDMINFILMPFATVNFNIG
jgi:hypothetical protein